MAANAKTPASVKGAHSPELLLFGRIVWCRVRVGLQGFISPGTSIEVNREAARPALTRALPQRTSRGLRGVLIAS
jgi:hypothetical protein